VTRRKRCLTDKAALCEGINDDRRGFFAAIVTGAVAGIVRPASAGGVEPAGVVRGPRYRETAHVKTFYRVSRCRAEAPS
jgi:hypothetical protein